MPTQVIASNCGSNSSPPPVICDLVPLHKPLEVLLEGSKERPTLFVFGRLPLTLGRNRTTQISMIHISRHLCRIQYTGNDELLLTPLKSIHSVHVNGALVKLPLVLADQDIVSLFDQDHYQYKVRMRTTTTTSSSTCSSSTDQHTPLLPPIHEQEPYFLDQQQQHGVDDEFICAVCLNIFVKTTACHPCGHLYCRNCVSTQCHMCRREVTTLPMIHVDNIIYKLIQMGGIFSADDVEPYFERNTDLTLSEGERQQILNPNQPPPPKRQCVMAQPAPASGLNEEDAICID